MTAAALDRPRMRLVSFRPLAKGKLRGFANIELPSGLRIDECPILTSNGKAWATLPSKPVLDRDGKQIEVNGKKQYAAFLKWRDKDLSNRFSDALVELVRQHHPEALSEQAPA